jgi:hypothetical protein
MLGETACRRYHKPCSAAIKECDLFLRINPVPNGQAIKSTRPFPGTRRGWGPITKPLDGEDMTTKEIIADHDTPGLLGRE